MKILILDNLRSVYNVGSIFRTANACGVDKIFLCGITPTPLDKRGHRRSDFAKVALGAEDTVAWEFCETTLSCVEKLKEEGVQIISLEQDARAIDYKEVDARNISSWALVLGSEVDGIAKEVLAISDSIIELPMLGTKESLNVTIACGIALYNILHL